MAARNSNEPRQCLLTVKEAPKKLPSGERGYGLPTVREFTADIEFLDDFRGRIDNAKIAIIDNSISSDKIKPGTKFNAKVSGSENNYLLQGIL